MCGSFRTARTARFGWDRGMSERRSFRISIPNCECDAPPTSPDVNPNITGLHRGTPEIMPSTVELSEACCTLPPFKGSDYVPQGTIQLFEGNPDFILEIQD